MDTDEEVEIITDKEIKCEIEEDSESSDDSEEYFCDQCPSKFPSQGKLERHKKSTHERVYICPECGYQLIGKNCYDSHIKKHQKVKCETCYKEFSILSFASSINL